MQNLIFRIYIYVCRIYLKPASNRKGLNEENCDGKTRYIHINYI